MEEGQERERHRSLNTLMWNRLMVHIIKVDERVETLSSK
jgi:hypothetical protein